MLFCCFAGQFVVGCVDAVVVGVVVGVVGGGVGGGVGAVVVVDVVVVVVVVVVTLLLLLLFLVSLNCSTDIFAVVNDHFCRFFCCHDWLVLLVYHCTVNFH